MSERDFFERILAERRRAHDSEHFAHDEGHKSDAHAMEFARRTLETALQEAKANVAETHEAVTRRLDILESGGAPFASRLDDSLNRLKSDVDILKAESVKVGVLEQERHANTLLLEQQRRQIRGIFIAASASFIFSLVLLLVEIITRGRI